MNIDKKIIRSPCTDAVFEREQNYRNESPIQRIGRYDDVVTAAVQGSRLYDVTVELGGNTIDAHCTCRYDVVGECKHRRRGALDVAAEPRDDESDRVETVLRDVSTDELREFVRDALAAHPDLRDPFLARFGDEGKPFEKYRAEVERLFDQHTQDYPAVIDAIDFRQFFDLAEQYRGAGAT